MTDPDQPTGRRVARRPDVTVVLAVLLPLLTVAALLVVRPDAAEQEAAPPRRTELTRATLVCPRGALEASLSTSARTGGPVAVRVGKAEDETSVDLEPRVTATVPGEGPVVVKGEGPLAPGLVGGVAATPLAAAACREPVADQWFTGVGAGARHSSVLELVNPDGGPAVVDATLIGQDGVVDAPELRGIAVPARAAVRVELATTIPRRDELSLRVTTARGRVVASVRDLYDQLGAGASARDWLAAQATPATTNLMLGLVPGSGQRNLVLTNAGPDEARADVRVVTADSVFAPKGVEDIVVPPEAVARVSLSRLLPKDVLRDAVGLVVISPEPLTSTVRGFVDGDLSHAVPGGPVTSSALLLPDGKARLLLAGAAAAGTVTVTSTDASGRQLGRERVDVAADRGFSVGLPAGTMLVEVKATGTSVVGSVVVTGRGAAVLPLTELVRDSLVAQVRPGL